MTGTPEAEPTLNARRPRATAPGTGVPVPVDTPDGSEPLGRSHPRIFHGVCGRWWTGKNRGHCGACHETFMPGAFDAHQRISNGVITCSTAQLFPRDAEWGVLWAQNPEGDGTGYWATRKRDGSNDTGEDQ